MADAGWTLLVPAPEVAKVREALDACDEEARGEPDATLPEGASARTAWTVGLAVGTFLLGFFAVTGPPPAGRSRQRRVHRSR